MAEALLLSDSFATEYYLWKNDDPVDWLPWGGQEGLYRTYSNTIGKIDTDRSLYISSGSQANFEGPYGYQGGWGIGTMVSKTKVPIGQLYNQGYRTLHMSYNVLESSGTYDFKVIFGTTRNTMQGDLSAEYLRSAYTTYLEKTLPIWRYESYTVGIPLADVLEAGINDAYIALSVRNKTVDVYSWTLYTTAVKIPKIWIE